MGRRCSLGDVIERHFGAFRKSQRTTMAALCEGLLAAGRLGLASIAGGMGGKARTPHKIKRVDRFASNRGVWPGKATVCLAAWFTSVTRQTPPWPWAIGLCLWPGRSWEGASSPASARAVTTPKSR